MLGVVKIVVDWLEGVGMMVKIVEWAEGVEVAVGRAGGCGWLRCLK